MAIGAILLIPLEATMPILTATFPYLSERRRPCLTMSRSNIHQK